MWTPPLGPHVELPMGPRSAVLGGGDRCGHRHWGLKWSSVELPMGPRIAVLGRSGACGHRHWGLMWSSLWGHERMC
eukprot:3687317-Pyramimonas_sp.AAC.1